MAFINFSYLYCKNEDFFHAIADPWLFACKCAHVMEYRWTYESKGVAIRMETGGRKENRGESYC
jgi:hypothetical protein